MHTCEVNKTHLKKTLPLNVKADIVTQAVKVSWKFNIEVKIPLDKEHDLLYRAVCATNNCTEYYVGDTARRIVERAKN